MTARAPLLDDRDPDGNLRVRAAAGCPVARAMLDAPTGSSGTAEQEARVAFARGHRSFKAHDAVAADVAARAGDDDDDG